MLTIAYDPAIPYAKEFFSQIGELTIIDPLNLSKKEIETADILLIRSNIKVNKNLLEGTSVKAVCTASAGLNHIDLDYMRLINIPVFHGQGANGLAVADYVLAAFFATNQYRTSNNPSIGIVGLGNIGGQVYKRFASLGYTCIGYDPFITDDRYALHSLTEVLQCDVVTFHVPLTTSGLYPTFHMLNNNTLQYIRTSATLINSSRGEVIDTTALLNRIRIKNNLTLVFDVWENEPNINHELTRYCKIISPHIAGWSNTGRRKIAFQLYRQIIEHFGLKISILYKEIAKKKVFLESDTTPQYFLANLLQSCVGLQTLSDSFQKSIIQNSGNTAQAFKILQGNYANRLELSDYQVIINSSAWMQRLQLFGIDVVLASSAEHFWKPVECLVQNEKNGAKNFVTSKL